MPVNFKKMAFTVRAVADTHGNHVQLNLKLREELRSIATVLRRMDKLQTGMAATGASDELAEELASLLGLQPGS